MCVLVQSFNFCYNIGDSVVLRYQNTFDVSVPTSWSNNLYGMLLFCDRRFCIIYGFSFYN